MNIIIVHHDREILLGSTSQHLSNLLGTQVRHRDSQVDHQKDTKCLFCHKQIYEIIPSDDRQSIGIETIQELQSHVKFKYSPEEPLAVLIHEAHTLTVQAQNALLKTLEDDRAELHFVLTVNHQNNLLPTILSRAQIKFPQIAVQNDIQAHTEEQFDTDMYKYAEQLLGDDSLSAKLMLVQEIVQKAKDDNQLINNITMTMAKLLRANLRAAIDDNRSPDLVAKQLKLLHDIRQKLTRNVNKKIALEHWVLSTI